MSIINNDKNYTIDIFNELYKYEIISQTQLKNILSSITIDSSTDCWISNLTSINKYPITGHNRYIYQLLANYIWDIEKIILETGKKYRIGRTCPNRECINPNHIILADRLGICEIRNKLGRTARGSNHGRCTNPEIYKKLNESANSLEIKERAIKMSDAGISIIKISRILELPYQTVYAWIKQGKHTVNK